MLTLESVVVGAGGLTVLIVAIKTLTTWKPALWVFRRLVSEPVRSEMEGVIDAHIAPVMERNRRDIAEIHGMMQQVLGEVTFDHGFSLKDLARENVESIRDLRRDYASLAIHLGRIEAEVFRQE